ncbi:MAG: glutamate--tRNA ligase [Bacillota bacterium]|nr:glutamate--tRNA ligase [Clostridiales bacterium]MDD7131288.1 glutamate--tRNA ligase [Bacillota bacterium]MDO4472305.1 glutamate--tRNA ligase [Bacillota bacterium]
MDYNKLAELLFPNIDKTPEDYEALYPARGEDRVITRLGPSPTGFIHLGNLYGAFVDERLAHRGAKAGNPGTFYLRIEDTDDKRFVEGAVETIINSLKFFGITFDEGAALPAPGQEYGTAESGSYGPYFQSKRGPIYQTFAKKLVSEGKAYPCFLSEEEIADIRAQQEAAKETTGIYGKYAEKNRNLTYEEIEANISAGKPYVVRLKSDGDTSYFKIMDAVRGEVSMPGNNQDTIILKANGIPTYHFAHVIDDHLMGTTHVVRGEEWLMSLPIHVELFTKLGFEMPVYCHTAVLMKVDEETGNKRKLSKRKDPELSLDYYRKQGYHPQAVKEYLLTILNSNFEEWRMANPDADIDEFDFTTEKMSSAGALFDLNKLNDISKDVLLKIPADELADFILGWAKEFKPQIAPLLEDRDYLTRILDLGRDEAKPRKDLIYASQIWDFISYFYDDYFVIQERVPEQVSDEDAKEILSRYLDTYDHSDDQSAWFEKIRTITADLGYAVKPKDYKKHPEEYKGSVAHVSTVIRIAVMGRSQSPDVWSIQQILGEDKVRSRISQLIG